MYTSREKALRAYRAYLAQKGESIEGEIEEAASQQAQPPRRRRPKWSTRTVGFNRTPRSNRQYVSSDGRFIICPSVHDPVSGYSGGINNLASLRRKGKRTWSAWDRSHDRYLGTRFKSLQKAKAAVNDLLKRERGVAGVIKAEGTLDTLSYWSIGHGGRNPDAELWWVEEGSNEVNTAMYREGITHNEILGGNWEVIEYWGRFDPAWGMVSLIDRKVEFPAELSSSPPLPTSVPKWLLRRLRYKFGDDVLIVWFYHDEVREVY